MESQHDTYLNQKFCNARFPSRVASVRDNVHFKFRKYLATDTQIVLEILHIDR